MKKKKISLSVIILFTIIALVLAAIVTIIILNKSANSFEKLSQIDQSIIEEYNNFIESSESNGIWPDYDLTDKTIVAISTDTMTAYIFNSSNNQTNILTQNVSMPNNMALQNVKRVCMFAPQTLFLKLQGSFNTVGVKNKFFGDEIYFITYNKKNYEANYSSQHFITYLSHESFHYYMQNSWTDEDSYDVTLVTNDSLNLYENKFEILEKMHKLTLAQSKDKAAYMQLVGEYLSNEKVRSEKNAELVKLERARETSEGTATYVGIRASQICGYDFGVMYFSNVKDVPFSDIMPQVREGNVDYEKLTKDIPYESGAELCLVMDELGVQGWKEKLNAQKNGKYLTLYDVLKEYYDSASKR